jgi:hypothetical protein
MTEALEKPARTKAAKAAVIAKVTARLDPPSLGAMTDKMWALREQKRGLDAQVKAVEVSIKELEGTLFTLLDAQDTRKAEGKKASVSIGESVVGAVENWDATWAYIAKNKFFHLVQKRLSDPALRELWALGKVVPGVQPFTKRTLSVRSL